MAIDSSYGDPFFTAGSSTGGLKVADVEAIADTTPKLLFLSRNKAYAILRSGLQLEIGVLRKHSITFRHNILNIQCLVHFMGNCLQRNFDKTVR